jgi:hypothetical protein
MRVFEWPIETIIARHPDLYLEHCAVMAVAQMSRGSASRGEFLVQCEGFSPHILHGESSFLLRVSWDPQSISGAKRVLFTEQRIPIVERAAVGIAALLFAHFVPGGSMRVTRRGERAEYWLPELKCALEISGTASLRQFRYRYRQKVAQMLANPRRWNGYVVACGFGTTQNHIRWSYHEQKE